MSTIAFTLMFAVWLMFGILGVPIQKELGLTDPQLAWITAVAVLNGSLWRLPAGMLTDRIGGRVVTMAMLLLTAIPCFFITQVTSYLPLLVLAFLVGFAGNLFSVGISWNAAWFPQGPPGLRARRLRCRQRRRLGDQAPHRAAADDHRRHRGRHLPRQSSRAAGGSSRPSTPSPWSSSRSLTLVVVPRHDRRGGAGKPVREMLAPLRHVRVWRFSLYYAAVFGAYVALAAWLPKYYVDNFDIPLAEAALLSATFIFPASLLRPVGGWFSDRYGARRVMYWTFAVMTVTTGILMMPNGHLVIAHADGSQSDHLGYTLGLAPFAILIFVLGCAMGVGKAAVYKHIPEYFPDNVGSVGGLVGMFGGLGGFVLPLLFAYTKVWSGFPTSTFFVLFLLTSACFVWMHLTVVRMLHQESPDLARHLESPAAARGRRLTTRPFGPAQGENTP